MIQSVVSGRLLSRVASMVLGLFLGLAGCQPAVAPGPQGRQVGPRPIDICSFNIQFLGQSRVRDNAALADLVEHCDIVVIQELVAPPYPRRFPDGTPCKPDPEAAAFFDEMTARGFAYVLSEEDTGTGSIRHANSAATEWWVAFYRPQRVRLASDLPGGFLAADRFDHPDYERVPYAFAFRTVDGATDFVLISVHLKPGSRAVDAMRRQHELAAIGSWIDLHDGVEKDFVILGDMNIEDAAELGSAVPPGMISLNDECRPTNTNVNGPRPYDHILFNPRYTTEIDRGFDVYVVDLIPTLRPRWRGPGSYPGGPPAYDHNRFRQYYTDHHPLFFRLAPGRDDD